MKRIIIILLAISCGYLKAADFNLPGLGTRLSPYIITTSNQLHDMAEMVNTNPGCSKDVYFELGDNIILWTGEQPIGFSDEFAFKGIFDGAGFSIRDFTLKREYADKRVVGLFGFTDGAEIRNLTIDGGRIYSEEGTFSGVLIGNALATKVEKCIVRNVDIAVSGNATGGFIGYGSEITVTGCSSDGGSVSGSNNVGGFIGKMEESMSLWGGKNTIKDCFSTCVITGVRNVGGFTGVIESSYPATEISDCYATGSVLGFTDNVGGLIGACQCNKTTIANSYTTGSVVGESRNGDSQYIGGFIGLNAALKIERCFASGSVTGNSFVGGFSGVTRNPSEISNCYAEITATDDNLLTFEKTWC